jgi:hypothetical protein
MRRRLKGCIKTHLREKDVGKGFSTSDIGPSAVVTRDLIYNIITGHRCFTITYL